jgi:hypothetical protein
MEKALHKKIIKVSLIAAFIGLALMAAGFIISQGDMYLTYGRSLISISLISMLVSYIIVNHHNIKLKKVSKYSLIIYPLFIAAGYLLIVLGNTGRLKYPSTITIIFIVTLFAVITFLSLLYIFLYTDTAGKRGTLIILFIVFLHFITRRFYIPYRMFTFILSSILISVGSIMFGIRCLYLAEKNTYFKYLAFLGNFFIGISFLALPLKLWGVIGTDNILYFCDFTMVIGTIIILVTFSSSGYLEWQELHKKILKRILIPWIFIFFLFIMRYLLPEVWKFIYSPVNYEKMPGFEMVDYSLKDNNKAMIK